MLLLPLLDAAACCCCLGLLADTCTSALPFLDTCTDTLSVRVTRVALDQGSCSNWLSSADAWLSEKFFVMSCSTAVQQYSSAAVRQQTQRSHAAAGGSELSVPKTHAVLKQAQGFWLGRPSFFAMRAHTKPMRRSTLQPTVLGKHPSTAVTCCCTPWQKPREMHSLDMYKKHLD